jgi:hypothetical protein
LCAQAIVVCAKLQTGYVAQAHNLAVATALEHDIAEFLDGGQSSLRINQAQKLTIGHRFGANLAS